MSIYKRTVIYDNSSVIRFSDWALVNTSLGTMAEPFTPNRKHSPDASWELFDATDMMSRIDEMVSMDYAKEVDALSGGNGTPLNGGILNHRVGK
jgi:hypothetical protein